MLSRILHLKRVSIVAMAEKHINANQNAKKQEVKTEDEGCNAEMIKEQLEPKFMNRCKTAGR